MNKLQTILNSISSIVTKNNLILDATGGRFNVFQIIGVTSDETRLHSAFINELLNVKGTHGLGDKFLRLFIQQCLDDDIDFQTSNSTSRVELPIGKVTSTTGGRIDIIITDNINQSIIIENKIYAGEQENQMLRYFNYSRRFSKSKLIYLTLDGSSPSEFSTGKGPIDYKTISYKYDILNWLSNCKQIAVDLPLIREAISHYINLIKHLTNTSIMEKMNNEIVEFVLQSPENFKSAIELGKALNDIKTRIQWKFWEQLKKSLEEKGVLEKGKDDPMNVNEPLVKGYYTSGKRYFGLWKDIFKKDGITLRWGCVVQSNIYVGFNITKDKEFGELNQNEFQKYRQIITECDLMYLTDSENWLGWKYIHTKLNFNDFDSQAIYDLVKESQLKSATDLIADQAMSDITRVNEKLKEVFQD